MPSTLSARSFAFTLAVTASAALGACADASSPAPGPDDDSGGIPFRIDGRLAFVRGADTLRTIDVEIADTDSARGRGLMERTEIPTDTGMLFVFPSAEPQGFWMQNTPHALDVQFYAADSTLLNVAENAVPFDPTTLPSDGPAQFVVEVEAGVSRRIGLVPGDRITWQRSGR